MRRTQIYLDEDQKRALKALALDRDSTVSDVVRDAVARLLRDEVVLGNFPERIASLQERVRASVLSSLGHEPTEAEVDEAARRARVDIAKKPRAGA